jgi:hypothetical protein
VEVRIGARSFDQGTAHIFWSVEPELKAVSTFLSRDYGSDVAHLWIDLELCPVEADKRPPWSLRFQKRVKPKPSVTGIPVEACYNVAHYSVRPDYFALARVPMESVKLYLLNLIYDSTAVLERKRHRFPNFNVTAFRKDFLGYLNERGRAGES